jgi:hypothetical protein
MLRCESRFKCSVTLAVVPCPFGQSSVAVSLWREVTRPRSRMLVKKAEVAVAKRPEGVKMERWVGKMRGVASWVILGWEVWEGEN